MPPRSTKAPKWAIFLTMPLRIWPGSISASELLLHLLALVLDQLAAAMTMLRRAWSIRRLAFGSCRCIGRGRPAGGCRPGGGEEDVDADVDEQPALDLAGDHPGDDVAFLVLGEGPLPTLSGAWPCGMRRGRGLVLHRLEQNLDLVAGWGTTVPGPRRTTRELDALALVADVHPDLVAGDLADPSGHDFVVLERLLLRRQPAVLLRGCFQLASPIRRPASRTRGADYDSTHSMPPPHLARPRLVKPGSKGSKSRHCLRWDRGKGMARGSGEPLGHGPVHYTHIFSPYRPRQRKDRGSSNVEWPNRLCLSFAG